MILGIEALNPHQRANTRDSSINKMIYYRIEKGGVILYFMPERLIKRNKILELQWSNVKTLIPCLLKSLYMGSIEVRLHELDKVFTGIVKRMSLKATF
jgi:hypothetical protein